MPHSLLSAAARPPGRWFRPTWHGLRRWAWRGCRWALGLLLVAWACALLGWCTLQWLILPRLDEWRPKVESLATRALGHPVQIGALATVGGGWLPMFELREIYAAAGFRATDWRQRFDDHLVLQLHYLRHILAAAAVDGEKLANFIDEHVGYWFPDFAQRVALGCNTPFYAALAELTHVWLSHLRSLPLDALKIDHSFVRDIASDASDLAIARGTIALAHSLGLRVVAEGVETEAEASVMRLVGVTELQGFFFSQAVAPDSVDELVAQLGRPAEAAPALPAALNDLRAKRS